MKPGDSTVELVKEVSDRGVDYIVLLMRHSAREYAPGKHDLLNPLTDEGRVLAKNMGEKLPKHLKLRGYASPPERCIETSELVSNGHKSMGGEISRTRALEALGVFYVLDQMKMYMAMQEYGGMVPLIENWFSGKIAEDIMMSPDLASRILGRLIKEKLMVGAKRPQLDILVSHDFTLFTIKNRLLGQTIDQYPAVIVQWPVLCPDQTGQRHRALGPMPAQAVDLKPDAHSASRELLCRHREQIVALLPLRVCRCLTFVFQNVLPP